jgi:hypothetical protein
MQERNIVIIQMTFTKKRSVETLLNAESRDGEICKCNAQSGLLRSEALLLHGEYDLPRCYRVSYGSMICHPRQMQLASILPPPSGHSECYLQITVTMPGAEAHIVVQSLDEIYVLIDDFTDVNLANTDHGLYLESTCTSTLTRWPGSYDLKSADETKAKPNYLSNH